MSAERDASLRRRLADAARAVDAKLDLLQLLKSMLAATAAWWISAGVMHSQLPFLAPWVALLTVQVTLYRSVRNGVQTWVASTLGVGISFLIGSFLGVHLWTFALAILIGLLGARVPRLRTEGVAIATTSIFVLGSGFGAQAPLLVDRVIEVALGVGVGLLVNLLIVPPLREGQAARHVDGVNRQMGEILVEMADDLQHSWDTGRADSWVEQTVSLGRNLASVGQAVQFARESARFNPRRRIPRPHLHRRRSAQGEVDADDDQVSYEEVLGRLGEGVATLRNLALTIRESTYAEGRWDEYFRDQWVSIMRDAGRSISDPDADVEPVQDRLVALSERMSRSDGLPPGEHWPVYGALIVGLERIATVVDDVASSRSAREGSAPNPRT